MEYIRKTLWITAAITLAATKAFAGAESDKTFDGQWSVRIASSSSACGNGQIIPIGISNGTVSSSMVKASGSVAEAGDISVTLASGAKRATGSGHLSGTSGSGTWTGA